MNLCILIFFGYIVLCLLLSIFVQCVRDNWKWVYRQIINIYNDIRYPGKRNIFKSLTDNGQKSGKFAIAMKIVFLFIISGIGYFLIFLIIPFYLYWLNKSYKQEKQHQKNVEESISEKDNTLYFWQTGGAGQIVCIDCGYKEEIVSFLHGFGDDCWTAAGHQCQSCGKFYTLGRHSPVINIDTPCSCGGKLSREEPVFCPQCKSKNVEYEVDIIT